MAILSLLALLLKGYGVSVASETGGLPGVSPKANPAPVAPPHAADSHLFFCLLSQSTEEERELEIEAVDREILESFVPKIGQYLSRFFDCCNIFGYCPKLVC